MMSMRRCAELLLLVSSIGCATFQDCEYRAAQKCRAHRAWWFAGDERCSSIPWSHYSCGWRHGYTDVLMGGDGECPPVPPQHYWSHKFQSEHGEIAIENWYSGYHDGAAAAIASCRDRYHPVPISGTFRQCYPSCLSSDQATYPLGRTILGMKQRPQYADDEDELMDTPAGSGDPDSSEEKTPSQTGTTSTGETTIPPSPLTLKLNSDIKSVKRTSGSWIKTSSTQSRLSDPMLLGFNQNTRFD